MTVKKLTEPLRPDHRQTLEFLARRINEALKLVERGCPLYRRVEGHTSKLAGFLNGARNEVQAILTADDVAERDRRGA